MASIAGPPSARQTPSILHSAFVDHELRLPPELRPILPRSAEGAKPDPMAAKDISPRLGRQRSSLATEVWPCWGKIATQHLPFLSLSDSGLVVAVSDGLRNDQGFLTVGHVRSTEVVWDDWQLFSDGPAFSPKLASMGEKMLIAYRDGEEQGRGRRFNEIQ